ncbi:MAG: hypothetical protein IJD83_00500 [Clostridia bacterium]|nr:hypothetical protein [Clostridia bacterium]
MKKRYNFKTKHTKLLSAMLLCVAVFFIWTLSVGAEDFPHANASQFTVSGAFSDNMILQQNEPVTIWGTSTHEGGIIHARIADSLGYGVVKDGKWEITLSARSASPQTFTIELWGGDETERVNFENVQFGDVWWVIGQSNIEYTLNNLPNWPALRETIDGTHNVSALYLNKNDITDTKIPLEDIPNRERRWKHLTKYSAQNLSALGTLTAMELTALTGNQIPTGFVSLGFSGRDLLAFMPDSLTGNRFSASKKSELYNNFIAPLMKQKIRGIIWYQGEANAAAPYEYADAVYAFITYLRENKAQQNRDFPFYITELSPCFSAPNTNANWQFIDFGMVRAVSGSLPSRLKNTYICVSSDTWSDTTYANNLHPYNKEQLAKRLALMIVSKEYALTTPQGLFAPTFKKASYLAEDKTAVRIEFDVPMSSITTAEGQSLRGFVLMDKHSIQIEDYDIQISSENSIDIQADIPIFGVAYNCRAGDTHDVTLTLESAEGVPAAAFYTVLTKFEPVMQLGAFSPRTKRLFYLACAAMLIFIGAGLWWFLRKRKKSKNQ